MALTPLIKQALILDYSDIINNARLGDLLATSQKTNKISMIYIKLI